MGAWSEQRENFCAFDTLSSRKRGIIFARLSHRHWSRCFSAGFRYVYFVVHIRIPMVNSFSHELSLDTLSCTGSKTLSILCVHLEYTLSAP